MILNLKWSGIDTDTEILNHAFDLCFPSWYKGILGVMLFLSFDSWNSFKICQIYSYFETWNLSNLFISYEIQANIFIYNHHTILDAQ